MIARVDNYRGIRINKGADKNKPRITVKISHNLRHRYDGKLLDLFLRQCVPVYTVAPRDALVRILRNVAARDDCEPGPRVKTKQALLTAAMEHRGRVSDRRR